MGDAAIQHDDGAGRLYDEAIELPDSERRALTLRLIDSLKDESADIERAWTTEARRRLDDIEAGRSEPAPWEEARARIFARG